MFTTTLRNCSTTLRRKTSGPGRARYLRMALLLLLPLMAISARSSGQTTLVRGDLVLTSFAAAFTDSLQFVVWKPMTANTQIRFTDCGFNSSGSANAAGNIYAREQVLTWTNSTGATIPAGTRIRITLGGSISTSLGSVSIFDHAGVSGTLNLTNLPGDQIFAYQSTNASVAADFSATNVNAATFSSNCYILFGLTWMGSTTATAWSPTTAIGASTSFLPSELNNSAYNFIVGTTTTAAQTGTYTGSTSGQAAFANYTAMINNNANWSTTPNASTTPVTWTTTNFTITFVNTAPAFALTSPQSLSVCQNAAATNIKSLLNVNDNDAAQTLTWTQQSAPSHGTLNISSATASTGGTNIAPGGTMTYTPTSGYSGSDAFTIRVSDGFATADMVVNVTVNASPSIDAITNQSVCHNTSVAAVTLTGSSATAAYTWTNNTTSIGLAASGTGDIASFTGTNATTAAVTATVTATATENGCSSSTNFTITVKPIPTVNNLQTQVRCNGETQPIVTPTGAVAGTVFNWTNSNLNIGLGASGVAPVPTFTAVNPIATGQINGVITVTPVADGCTGTAKTYFQAVNPTIIPTAVANKTFCEGLPSGAITITGSMSGATFPWVNSNTAVGLAASGTGTIASFTPTNGTSAPISAIVIVSPTVQISGKACAGIKDTFTITVVPPAAAPTVSIGASATTICTGTQVTFTATPTNEGTTPTYQWKVNGTNAGTNSATFVTSTLANGDVVTCTLTSSVPCAANNPATSNAVTMTVIPTPTLTVSNVNAAVTQGTTSTSVPYSGGNATQYILGWISDATGQGFVDITTSAPGSVSGGVITIAVPATAAPGLYEGTITPYNSTGGCFGTPTDIFITVNSANVAPSFTLSTPQSLTVCKDAGATSIAALLHASDADAGQTLTWTAHSAPAHGAVTLTGATASSGSTNIAPGGTLTYTPTAGYSGNDAFTIRVSDGSATSDMVVNVTVNAVSGSTIVTNVSCFGGVNGSINLTPAGGATPYTYNWGGGVTTEDRTGLAAGSYSVTIADANGCAGTVNATVTEPSTALSGSTTVTNASCFGGTNGAINLTPIGGTAPYTYNWGGGITTEDRTGLAAGSYSVTITDNKGCTAISNATITQPGTQVSGSTVVTNVSCHAGANGAINLTPAGGVAPYTFNWGGGITTEDRTGLTATSYSVTITDDNGCTGTVNATVSQPATALSGSTTVTSVTCFGGTNGAINLTPAGGTAPYTFDWGGGITTEDRTGLTAGSYSATITDNNGCTAIASGNITQPSLPPTVDGGADVTVCDGNPVTLTASGNAASYSWSNGVTNGVLFVPSSTTTYTVTGTDANNCTNTDQVTVTVNTLPTMTMATTTATVSQGTTTASLAYSAASGTEYVVNWNTDAVNEGFSEISTSSPGILTGVLSFPVPATATPGTYSGTVQAYNSTTGCLGMPTNIQVIVTAGNTAPVFTLSSPQTLTICEDAPATSVLGLLHVNDQDAGQTLNWTVQVAPEHGLLVNANANAATGSANITPGGVLSYLVNSSYDGPDSVVIRVSDGAATADMIIHITVNNNPAVSAGNDVSVCAGGSVTLSGSGATSYTWNNSVNDGVAFTPSSTMTYTVTGTDANNCSNTDQVNVTVNALPNVDAGTDAAVCNGTSVTLSGSGATSYTWNNSVTDGQSFVPTATTTYTVTGTDANNCSNTDQVTITVNNKPVLTPSQTNVSCNGGSNGAASVIATGASPFTYTWTGVTNATNSASGLSAGSYSVEVIDDNGCGIIEDFIITEPTALSATISNSTNVTCFGGTNGAATVNVIGGTTPYTYSWDNSATAASITTLTAGTYNVTVTDGHGCTTTATATITQPLALPAVNAGNDMAICLGQTATLNGSGAVSYTWNNSITNGVAFNPIVTDVYTVTGTDANGCVNTDQVTVTVNALPNVFAGPDADICAGQSVILFGTGTATSYSWNNGVVEHVAFAPSATTTYTITGTDGNGCTNTDAITITVKQLPAVNAGTDVAVCAGQTVTLTGSGNAASYTWNGISDGVAFTPILNGTYTVTGTGANGCTNTDDVFVTVNNLPAVGAGSDDDVCIGGAVTLNGSGAVTYSWNNSITNGVAFAPAGTATYTVTGTDGNGCSNTDDVTITVNALPIVSAGSDDDVCAGGTVTLSGSGASSYNWNNSVTDGVAFAPSATATYTVTGTDGNGCTNTDQVTITVNTLPAVDAGNDVAVCIGQSATLSGAGAVSYAWNNSLMDGVSFVPSSTTTYTVTGTDGNGCTNTDAVTVTVNALPTVSAGNDAAICIGNSITLSGAGAVSYSWDNGVNDGISFAPSSTATYMVTGTDGNGCVNTDNVIITVNALPSVSAGGDQTICGGSSTSINGAGAVSYSWTGGVTNGVAFTPMTTGTYTVTGTDGNGCTNTDDVTVTLHVPAITTNGTVTVCKGDTVTLTAPAGTGYSWKKGSAKIGGQITNTLKVTAIGTFNYSVTYTDPICGKITTAPVTVTINKVPGKPKVTNSTVACVGGTMTVSGPAGYANYAWTLNGDPVAATTQDVIADTSGDYTLIVTDTNGCVSPVSALKKIKFKPLPSSVIKVQKVFSNGSIRLMAATGAAYQWYFNGSPMAGVTTRYNTITQSGDYRLFIVGQNGCENTSADTNIVVNYTGSKLTPAEQEEESMLNGGDEVLEEAYTTVSVAPNPSAGVFHIYCGEPVRAVVRDIQGRVVADIANATSVDITEQASGIYLLQLYNSNGKLIATQKLNKQ